MKFLGILRWVAGGVVFVAAAVSDANGYVVAAPGDQDVQTALQFALSDQSGKNRSAVKLLSVISAERQASVGENVRLCLSLDRPGRTDTARVVVYRNTKKDRLSVTLWAWGACGK